MKPVTRCGENNVRLFTTGEFPCEWEDLVDEKRGVYATVYTLQNARKDPVKPIAKPGITRDEEDGIYDIVIDAPELTKKTVRNALRSLSKLTGVGYVLA